MCIKKGNLFTQLKNVSERRGRRDGLTDSYFWRSSYALKYPPRKAHGERNDISVENSPSYLSEHYWVAKELLSR